MAISAESIDFRRENLEDIKTNSYPDLQQYSKLIEIKLRNFKEEKGLDCFIDLFRLSANIPEPLKPDSSEEKVYSKYTDTLLCLMFNFIGIPSEVLAARSDSADVVSVDKQYGLDFVSDAWINGKVVVHKRSLFVLFINYQPKVVKYTTSRFSTTF